MDAEGGGVEKLTKPLSCWYATSRTRAPALSRSLPVNQAWAGCQRAYRLRSNLSCHTLNVEEPFTFTQFYWIMSINAEVYTCGNIQNLAGHVTHTQMCCSVLLMCC